VDNINLDIQEVKCGGVDWIELVEVRNKFAALLNAVMNIPVPENARNFLTSYSRLGSQDGLCSIE